MMQPTVLFIALKPVWASIYVFRRSCLPWPANDLRKEMKVCIVILRYPIANKYRLNNN